MASESAERSLEMEGGRKRKESNKRRIMDRGSRETEWEGGRERSIQSVLYFASWESAYHGKGQGRSVGVGREECTHTKFSCFLFFFCFPVFRERNREYEIGEQVRAEGMMTKMRSRFKSFSVKGGSMQQWHFWMKDNRRYSQRSWERKRKKVTLQEEWEWQTEGGFAVSQR